MISVGKYFGFAIHLIVLFSLFFFASWLVSRKIKKNILVIALIIWLTIFIINISMCLIKTPLIIGFNATPALDGSKNGKYISLGYGIEVKGYNSFGKSNAEMHIISLLDLFK